MASQDEVYDGSNLKDTEYDFPLPLLDKAQVTTLKSADQPKYNEDLAKVTSQAMNAEAADRASADAAEAKAREEADAVEAKAREEADAAEAQARKEADDKLQAAVTAEETARKAADAQLTTDITDAVSAAVTVPSADAPGKNALDSDLFETQEVNGQTGVTLKAGAITNEYVGEGAIDYKNIQAPTDFYPIINARSRVYSNPSYLRAAQLFCRGVTGNAYSIIAYGESVDSTRAVLAEIPYVAFPYTNKVSTFTYDAPNDNITSVTERYNLVSFGILSLILVQAIVVFANAGDAYVTLTKGKAWPSDGYRGVTDAQPTDFSPFLIAEGPDNPSAVSTTLAHDDTNGFRLQLHSDAAGSYECEYVLGNIDKNLFTNPFRW